MGSPINIDGVIYHIPHGKIVWFDTMESGAAYTVHWTEVKASAGTTAYATDRAYGGAQSLKFVTAKTAADYQGAIAKFGVPSDNLHMGLYFCWMTDAALANFQDMTVKLDYYDGTLEHLAQVKYIGTDGSATEKWQYYNSTPAFADVTSGTQELVNAIEAWHWMKLVVDFSNNKYKRLFSDGSHYDLSSLDIYTVAAASTKPRLDIQITVADEGTAAVINLWVDNVILTVMEDK